MKLLSVFLTVACCVAGASAGERWLEYSAFADGGSYREIRGLEGVSGALPEGWRDNSGWSGSKVKYGFKKEGASGYLSVSVKGEGMCQFFNPAVPKLDRLACFNFIVRGRSSTGADVMLGVRDTENDHAYSVMAKVALTSEWQEHVVPVSGGPAAPKSAFFVELFSPGAVDLASIRVEQVAPEQFVPTTAKAVAREDEWWQVRNRELVERAVQAQPDFMILGDSITQRWEQDGREAWAKSIAPLKAANFGIDGDGTEHLLWRIQNSGLGKRFTPKAVAVLIGVNNIGRGCLPNDVILGLAACVKAIRSQSPATKVLVLGVFPAGQSGGDDVRGTIRAINKGYAALADNRQVFYADVGGAFLEKDGAISPAIMADFLHLTPKGYGIYAREVEPAIRKVLAGQP